MQSKWSHYLSAVALVAGAAAASYAAETMATGQASGWSVAAAALLSVVGKAVLTYLQKQPPAV